LVFVLLLFTIASGIYLIQVGYFKSADIACKELGYTHGVFNGDGANIDCYTVPYEIKFKSADTTCKELGYNHGIFNGNGSNLNCYNVPYEIKCTRNRRKGLVCER